MKRILAALSLTLLGLGLTGCQSPKVTAHIGGGYEEIKHPTHPLLGGSDIPRVSFEHLGADGKTSMVWPALYGMPEVVHDNIIIFIGEKAFIENGSKAIHPRLFAVSTNTLPLDLTDEMLWRWAHINNQDFAKTLQRFSFITPQNQDGKLVIHLEFWSPELLTEDKDWPDKSDLTLEWKLVAKMMQAVKAKGVVKQDLRWKTPYIGEVY